ncbi:histidine kinase [Prochlorococcus sp. MIT 1300]|uniref:histidine kinase n=1 Tax=Prochlorococcus sp. MIT 1300 TaxID=3096218 RepID=UPI002A7579A7|nr:histidine kinase [Prochlorococcus sp. MIT 1300]
MDVVEANKKRQQLKLLLVAGRQHLSRGDLRELIKFLEGQDCGFDVTLEISDPGEQPELLEFHRLIAIPALIKLSPAPKQVFAGSSIFKQLRDWLPRWKQDGFVKGLALSLKPTELDGTRTPKELRLEDELLVLRQENETLIDRIGTQERLLRMVAHELRTPLSAAVLAVQSQQLGQIDLKQFQDVIQRRLEEIELLSKDLLEVGSTRWEALFNPQRLDLANVAAESILELEKLWLKRGIIINTDIPSDLPDVFADQRRMRQVLLNLIENALKFTNEGGKISLTILHRTNNWVQVSVSDSGPGIPINEQHRIFLDQVRLPQTSKNASGFGVGLSVCRRIVEVHGGRIWVVSEPQEGACFHFTVPVWQGQEGQRAGDSLTEGEAEP